uniref:Uncharacterized protein n=1 Tax=Ditylenchus dipsaci TaxID=166011 RepID=A0A915CMZ9_9BILA
MVQHEMPNSLHSLDVVAKVNPKQAEHSIVKPKLEWSITENCSSSHGGVFVNLVTNCQSCAVCLSILLWLVPGFPQPVKTADLWDGWKKLWKEEVLSASVTRRSEAVDLDEEC